jgi:hypothetical protein
MQRRKNKSKIICEWLEKALLNAIQLRLLSNRKTAISLNYLF